jgi:hypothetical protein
VREEVKPRWPAIACLLCALTAGAQSPSSVPNAFEIALYKDRFEHEISFRAAAIEVAWGAETLCDHTGEIEPFVLWSLHSMRKRLSGKQEEIFKRATGMDERWRIAWVDESVPEEVKLGRVVVAINGEKLPSGTTKFELSNVFRGNAIVSGDDGPLWEVISRARAEAKKGKPISLQFEDGGKAEVSTQTGCTGSVSASSFDSDPDKFWRQGTQRIKMPADAMLEARSRDEFRWLAAFGTYFLASSNAVGRNQQAENASTAFAVGKVLALALPGAGMVLSAAEAQAERTIMVDGVVGSADLFATEVVASLGGDPAAGLKFARRLREKGIKGDIFDMTDFRLSAIEQHVGRIRAIQAAAEKAQREAEAAERRAAQQRRAPQ